MGGRGVVLDLREKKNPGHRALQRTVSLPQESDHKGVKILLIKVVNIHNKRIKMGREGSSTVGRALTLHAADQGFIPASHMVPWALPGTQSKEWPQKIYLKGEMGQEIVSLLRLERQSSGGKALCLHKDNQV